MDGFSYHRCWNLPLFVHRILGLRRDWRRDTGTHRADQNPRRQRLAPLRAQSDVHWSRARYRRTSVVVPFIAHCNLHGLHVADCSLVCSLLRRADFAQAVRGGV